jgi:hypothetical protein
MTKTNTQRIEEVEKAVQRLEEDAMKAAKAHGELAKEVGILSGEARDKRVVVVGVAGECFYCCLLHPRISSLPVSGARESIRSLLEKVLPLMQTHFPDVPTTSIIHVKRLGTAERAPIQVTFTDAMSAQNILKSGNPRGGR